MKNKKNKNSQDLPGYEAYPESEDIFNNMKEEDIDPEELQAGNLSAKKEVSNKPHQSRDSELDVPGSELDDELEEIGDEDEENNYYSLGGENHEDLEEDKL